MDNNAYLLAVEVHRRPVLIDAAAEPGRAAGPDRRRRRSRGVVTTHQHGDHWQALAEVVAATGARTYAHPDDAAGIPVATDVLLDDGDTCRSATSSCGSSTWSATRPGSIALVYDDPEGAPHMFTGDSLFPGGRRQHPRDAARLHAPSWTTSRPRSSAPCPDETWVYPGHGNDTTLGAERPHLAEWRDRGW